MNSFDYNRRSELTGATLGEAAPYTYAYSPYGLVSIEGDTSYQPLQWSSEVYDAELGLVYYNYRYYNPLDGRWTRRDPVIFPSSFNLYSFCSFSPTFIIDREGGSPLVLIPAILAAAFGLASCSDTNVPGYGGPSQTSPPQETSSPQTSKHFCSNFKYSISWKDVFPIEGQKGVISQHVKWSLKVFNNEGEDISHMLQSYDYTEYWDLSWPDELLHDRISIQNSKMMNTKGEYKIRAEAFLIIGTSAPVEAQPDPRIPSGDLPMMHGEHHAEGIRVASKTRTITVEWDCTCGRENPTKVTVS